MEKVDFKRTLKHLYQPSKKDFALVEVPPMQFLMVDGKGDPNTAESYQQALEALYAVAYGVKFASKQEHGRDYTVPPLEGLWWAEDMEIFTTTTSKEQWLWTMMIMQPDWISASMVTAAHQKAAVSKDLPALEALRLESYVEGLSVQILHIGPYDAEGPTIERLHREFLPQEGLVENGKHHEIYLSDPRRVAPEKWKTVLRQPVRRR
jgi:hypothetical protein